ncbi:iron(III) transport system ATP-binding protein [Thermocatellispora tengchongensis]|uniref:ABC-type quaternary amine transporter n=1 Tax=Thermocatellispora tengchongensis TaxID=1073253 RepID=A0A840NY37_9ACTN|nr:ABC transporter ATP-binding protein [Thermocatellispora tengchongensis]MBB5132408.1 iron(III) transport system ATP-binding protein [Thermocatellispora tengchongensis]
MPDLTLTKVAKSFGVNVVLHDLDLHVRDGELFTLLGPSGCGKSTTLWSIAGLHSPDRGTIAFGDRVVFDGGRIDVAPERRNCGVVFQSYAVWPHLSVHDNVAYPLKLRKERRPARAARVREVLELVELAHLEHRYPHELSGGQQQRVALARALAYPPDLLLLDEPFSNLDAKLRERAREWLRALQQRIGVTTVFVTHDQDEALSMSDRIMVMDQGRVRQVGTPEEIYQEPADVFVADFVGTVNVLPGRAAPGANGTAQVWLDGLGLPLVVPAGAGLDGDVRLTVRPERIVVHPSSGAPADAVNVVTVKVRSRAFLGDHYRYVADLGERELVVRTLAPVDHGSELIVELPPDAIRVFGPA